MEERAQRKAGGKDNKGSEEEQTGRLEAAQISFSVSKAFHFMFV